MYDEGKPVAEAGWLQRRDGWSRRLSRVALKQYRRVVSGAEAFSAGWLGTMIDAAGSWLMSLRLRHTTPECAAARR